MKKRLLLTTGILALTFSPFPMAIAKNKIASIVDGMDRTVLADCRT